ncbi:hypothetical protein Glove_230g68 [Diversispora epigaea]|uniref:Uncharacterized protein n=1 Tax=Diversispora epigaea TaxID=1348612 RepID=A0A397IKU8_9GLOM|nr:hypothetical protein Glove_230g68 [Diversispora epigaea]
MSTHIDAYACHVRQHSLNIQRSSKHARKNGAPLLVKPIICRLRFLNDEEFVNMSLNKTDAKTGKPILYLQDTKKVVWEVFSEEYPNRQYAYRENLGSLCYDCGYIVFGDDFCSYHGSSSEVSIKTNSMDGTPCTSNLEELDDEVLSIANTRNTKKLNANIKQEPFEILYDEKEILIIEPSMSCSYD